MARSVLAVVAGFLVIAVPLNLANLLMFAIVARTPQSGFPPSFEWLNAASSLVLAVAGGYVAARLSRRRPVVHASVLGVILLLLTALTLSIGRPPWIPRPSFGLALVVPPLGRFGCTVIGGLLAAHLIRRRSAGIVAH
jgi:hypothetical protein